MIKPDDPAFVLHDTLAEVTPARHSGSTNRIILGHPNGPSPTGGGLQSEQAEKLLTNSWTQQPQVVQQGTEPLQSQYPCCDSSDAELTY